jgi:type I restriction enzyme S subunit
MKKGWEIKKINEIVEFQRGLTYSKKDEVDFSDNVVLRSNNIDLSRNQLDFTELRFISPSIEIPENKKVKKGSLLICTANGSKIHLGKVALIDEDYSYAFGGFMGLLKPKQLLDSKYLFYSMTSDSYRKFIIELSDGANINNLKYDDLGQFEIPLPPLPEQQRIVSILDRCFTAIDKAKANAEQNLKNAKELFESYLHDVFENGNWEMKTLNEISENLDSKRVPITKNVRNEGSIPYYGASGIVDYVADYLFDEDLLCVSEDGANLLARTYPIAFSITGKTWVNNHAHVLRFKDVVSQKFVELYLNSIKLDDFVSGMAQPKLNQKMLNKIPIPFPPLKDQQTIVHKLDALSTETQKLEASYQQKIADLDELKKSILQKAFSGELSDTELYESKV